VTNQKLFGILIILDTKLQIMLILLFIDILEAFKYRVVPLFLDNKEDKRYI